MSIEQYDTEIEKIRYYKEQIANVLVRQGIHADEALLDKHLKAIDTSLAIFQYKDVQPKTSFDINKFNKDFSYIYADLEILYKLAYKYCIEEYEKVRLYAENHLLELEALSRKYEKQNKFETSTASIGDTLFFQASGFDMDTSNEITKILLDTIKAAPQSKIACMIDADNIDDSQIIFNIGGQTCLPYSLNHDYINVPGERKTKTYDYTVKDNINSLDMRAMNIESFSPNSTNTYSIFAGNNMVLNTSNNIINTVQISDNNLVTCYAQNNSTGKIYFYIKDGTYAKFDFAYKPLYTNFSDTYQSKIKNIEYIEIEYNNVFSFSIVTDGKIYADNKTGIIKENVLYYPSVLPNVTKYHIVEYSDEKSVSLEASVIITGQEAGKSPSINMIALKQLPGDDTQ